MTHSYDVLDQLRTDWRHLAHRGPSTTALRRLRERHVDAPLGGIEDLGDLVDALEVRGGRSVTERARLVQVMLEEAADPDVHRALLQTLLPGIVNVCRQLRFGAGVATEPSETVCVASVSSLEVCTETPESLFSASARSLESLRCAESGPIEEPETTAEDRATTVPITFRFALGASVTVTTTARPLITSNGAEVISW